MGRPQIIHFIFDFPWNKPSIGVAKWLWKRPYDWFCAKESLGVTTPTPGISFFFSTKKGDGEYSEGLSEDWRAENVHRQLGIEHPVGLWSSRCQSITGRHITGFCWFYLDRRFLILASIPTASMSQFALTSE